LAELAIGYGKSVMKEADLSPTGADQPGSSYIHNREPKVDSHNADISALSPEITLALVETERDFLLRQNP